MSPGTVDGMDYDVIVIGGGAAGLSGAINLARSRRRVLVLDGGQPRNAPAAGVHAFLSRDGMPPGDLLRTGAAELARYGGELRHVEATTARALEGGFAVSDADGATVTARRLLVTTGGVDELPDVAGLRERWGRDVVHCPYCHGWEVRDQRIAVLATSPMAMHQVMLFSQLTDDLTLLLHRQPEPDAATARRLDALGARVVPGEVAAIETTDDRITGARLTSGEVVACDAVVVASRVVARSGVLDGLGLAAQPLLVGEVDAGRYVPADPAGRTAVPGVWVAGNVTAPMQQVIAAAAAGTMAGAQLNAELIEEDVTAKLAG